MFWETVVLQATVSPGKMVVQEMMVLRTGWCSRRQ